MPKKTLHAGTVHTALATPAGPYMVPSKSFDTFAVLLPRVMVELTWRNQLGYPAQTGLISPSEIQKNVDFERRN